MSRPINRTFEQKSLLVVVKRVSKGLQDLKATMTKGPVLSLIDVSKPFEIEIDAFDFVPWVSFSRNAILSPRKARSSIMGKGDTLSSEKKCSLSSIALES